MQLNASDNRMRDEASTAPSGRFPTVNGGVAVTSTARAVG